MIDIYRHLEKGNESELRLRSYDEILSLLRENEKYVRLDKQQEFIDKATAMEKDCILKVDKIKVEAVSYYESEKNNQLVEFEDNPELKKEILRTEIKVALINLILEYFDKTTFCENKKHITKVDAPIANIEKEFDLYVSLLLVRNRLYTFLSVVGYHQRTNKYFLSNQDKYDINYKYTGEVNKVNSHLHMPYQTFDIFYSGNRLDQNKFIDIDKISLLNLIYPYFKINRIELIEIIKIIDKYFSRKYVPSEFQEYQEMLVIKKKVELLSDDDEENEIVKKQFKTDFKKMVSRLKWDKVQSETTSYLERRRNEGAMMVYR